MEAAPERPPVTVAVVSWNTRELLAECLRSLRPEVDAGRAAVWVVDNGSSDGSEELVRREFPWVTLVEPGRNLGFGAAVDVVAERTDSPWLAPSNADVALEPGALERLLDAASDPATAVAAPRLVLPDGSTQHSVYAFPTVLFTLAFALGLPRLGRRIAPALTRRVADRYCLEGHWDPDRPRTVDWAVGAFLLVRRAAFEAVGGFGADQWMYAEDLDLGWRLARAGYSTRYEPRAIVRHRRRASTSVAFGEEELARIMTASYAVLARIRGPVRARITATVNYLGAAARVAWYGSLGGRSPEGRAAYRFQRRWLHAHREGLRALERGS